MPVSFYLLTIFGAFLRCALFMGMPLWALRKLAPKVPIVISAFAISGLYCVSMYLKPESITPNAIGALVTAIFTGVVLWNWKKTSELPLKISWPILSIFLYAFLIFFFRWEPSGNDPLKWGSFARLLTEYGSIPGDTRPLSPVANIGGINMGIPILISLFEHSTLLPWERSVLFLESLSLFFFCVFLGRALRRWFSPFASDWAAFFALVLFTNPVQYLQWGGTPTLVGLCFGFILLELSKEKTPLNLLEKCLYALALAFTCYAHPIGVYASFLVALPFILPAGKRLFWVGVLTALFFAPFLLKWQFSTSQEELLGVWELQKRMAPYLFREGHSVFYNLYTQIFSYLWSTAAFVTLALQLFWGVKEKRKDLLLGFLWIFGIIVIVVANVFRWWMPLSFLLYPERISTLLVLPFSFGVALCFEQVLKQKRLLIVIVGLVVLGGIQFQKRLFPILKSGQFQVTDRELLEVIGTHVPWGECIKINMETSAKWIPILSLRCTVPFHPLSESTQDESRTLYEMPTKWSVEEREVNGAKRLVLKKN